MPSDIFEYPSQKPFLKSARNHQRMWLREYLEIESTDRKRVLLPADKAYDGYNFYDKQVRSSVIDRFPKAFHPGRKGNPKPLISDALRSEHIPFNLFSPLNNIKDSKQIVELFSYLTGTKLDNIETIKIEYADPVAIIELGDNTKFDAYLIARTQNRQTVICIEVKYTEGAYPWGETEKRRMFDDSDEYILSTISAEEFIPRAYENFRNRHLKQIWRNYLLGIITSRSHNCDFFYIHLYPDGNHYQEIACSNFARFLTKKGLSAFKSITYEEYIEAAKSLLSDNLSHWMQYLEMRYIVSSV